MTWDRRSWLIRSCSGAGLLLLGKAFHAVAAPGANTAVRTIRIEARKFVYTPNQITLKKGEPVVLEITSLDFVHGFNVPEFHVRADLVPGRMTPVAFTPTRAGRFTFFCDNFCGSGHEDMNGIFTVEA